MDGIFVVAIVSLFAAGLFYTALCIRESQIRDLQDEIKRLKKEKR